jgi:hypothetical protein
MARWILSHLPPAEFQFGDISLPFLYHRYNSTWANERCVEIPIARHYLDQYEPRDVLEVGHVLGHYFATSHDVVDKFEKGRGIINRDILEFEPDRRYQLVISISTFEHIGYDDSIGQGSGDRILKALATCVALLAPAGKLVLTVPIGYNRELDEMILDGKLGEKKQWFLRRTARHLWAPTDRSALVSCRYGTPYPYANAIMVAEF